MVHFLRLVRKWCSGTLEEFLPVSDFQQHVISLHCFIHQELLYAQNIIKMAHTMDVVVKCVNEILTKGLKHCQFQSFLEEINAQYIDLMYHSQVHWLSRGRVLEPSLSLLEEIKIFLLEKNPTLKTR